jgi:hypothetical protein
MYGRYLLNKAMHALLRKRLTGFACSVLQQAQRVCGNKWNDIARHLPMRCNNDIKNHFNLYLKDKQHHVVADNTFLRQAYTLNKLLEEEPAEVAERRERLDNEKVRKESFLLQFHACAGHRDHHLLNSALLPLIMSQHPLPMYRVASVAVVLQAAASNHSHALQPVKVNRGLSALIHKGSTSIKPQVQPVQPVHSRVSYHPYLKVPGSAASAAHGVVAAAPQEVLGEQFNSQPQVFQLPRLHSNLSMGAMDSLALSAGSISGGRGSSAAAAVLYSTVAAAYAPVGQTNASSLRPVMSILPNQLLAHVAAEQQHTSFALTCPTGSDGHDCDVGQGNGFEQSYVPHQAYGSSSLSSLAEIGSGNSFSNQSSGWLVAIGGSSSSAGLKLAVTGSEDSTVKFPSRLQQSSGPQYKAARQPTSGLQEDNQPSSQHEILPIKLDPESVDTAMPLAAAEEGCLLSAGAEVDPSTLYSWFSSDDGELRQQALQMSEVAAAGQSFTHGHPWQPEQSGHPSSSSMHSGASSPDGLHLHAEQQQEQEQYGHSVEFHFDIAFRHSNIGCVKSPGELLVTLPAPCTNSAAFSPSCPRDPAHPHGAFHAGTQAAAAVAPTAEAGLAPAVPLQQSQEQQAGMFTPFGQAENQQQHMQHFSAGAASNTHNSSSSHNSSNDDSNSSQQYLPEGCMGVLAVNPNTLLQSAAAAMARVGQALQPSGLNVCSTAQDHQGPLPVALPGLLLALPLYQEEACEDLSDLEDLLDPDCYPLAAHGSGPLPAVDSTQPEADVAAGPSGPYAVAVIDALEDCAELVLSDDVHYEPEDDCLGHAPLHLLPHRSGSDALDAFACVW